MLMKQNWGIYFKASFVFLMLTVGFLFLFHPFNIEINWIEAIPCLLVFVILAFYAVKFLPDYRIRSLFCLLGMAVLFSIVLLQFFPRYVFFG